ncbi:MAG: YebC/PmpR family DNA-binding transcriptional regulator [Gammaproteobacteria bacterium]|nr:YebC/PmpR family DNA-binding transcriptional regulator [Gammaproteobacteria bacterium]
MAGHSKWANIQHRKGAQDRRRARVFGKLIRELTVAARLGGADVAANPRLRLAIDRARAQNMPRDTLERAVQRGTGMTDGAGFAEVTYEGYGPGGAAVLVGCLTDNRNRTVADIRQTFARHGGNLGAEGSVAYLFNAVGWLGYAPGVNTGALLAAAIEAGAEDVVEQADGSVEVLTDPAEFAEVRQRLEAAGFEPANAEVTRRAAVVAALDEKAGEHMVALLEALEEMDDVQNVYSNAAIPAAVVERLAAAGADG